MGSSVKCPNRRIFLTHSKLEIRIFWGYWTDPKIPHVVGFDVGVKMSSWILRDGSALFLDRLVAPKLLGIDINRDHHMLIFINCWSSQVESIIEVEVVLKLRENRTAKILSRLWVGGNLKNNMAVWYMLFEVLNIYKHVFFLKFIYYSFYTTLLRRATKCNDLLMSDPTILVHKTCLSETHRHGFVKSWLQKFVSDCTSARRRVVRISLWTGYGGSTWNIQFVGIQYGSNHRTSDHDDWGGTITIKKQGI